MEVRKVGHSCLIVADSATRIIVDPGTFAFSAPKLDPRTCGAVDAILITHAHADHADQEAIKVLVEANGARVYGNADVAAMLAPADVQVVPVVPGVSFTIGGIAVLPIDAPHEDVGAPVPANTAYLIGGKLLHPGDSFAPSLDAHAGVPLLALPVSAPWSTRPQCVAFAKRLAPKQAVPIHDGYLKDFFRDAQYQVFARELGETVFVIPQEGGSVTI